MANKLMLNTEWEVLFASLPDEQAGKLIKAVMACHAGKATRIDDPVLSSVFAMMESVIIKNREAYERKCETNAKNGSMGGRPKTEEKRTVFEKTEEKRTVNSETQENPTKANIKEKNIKEINKEKDKENNKETEKEIRRRHGEYKHILLTEQQYSDLLAEYGDALTKAAIDKVDKYCEETGKRYKNYFLVIKRWGVEAKRPEVKKVQWFTAGGHRDDGTEEAKRKLIAMQTGRTV